MLAFGTLIYKCFCACRPNLSDNQRQSEFPLFYSPPFNGESKRGGEIGNTIVVKKRSPSAVRLFGIVDAFLIALINNLTLSRAWLHVDQFPNVTIQILKSMAIHKTIVLRLIVNSASRGDCFSNHLIDSCSAFES